MSRRPLLLAAAVAAWLLAVAWLFRGAFVDDAYIGFRYVANLLAGEGFVFNPPDRVEGVTNTGWLLLLAPLAAVAGPPLAAKLLGLALLALTLGLTWDTARRLGSPLLSTLAVLAVATHTELVLFSLLGMETACLSALLAAMIRLAGRPGDSHRLPLLGVLAFLVRPEAVLVYPLGAVLASRWGRSTAGRTHSARGEPHPLRGLLLFAAGVAAVSLARRAYFGAWLPNTFAAKPGRPLDMLERLPDLLGGLLVNVGFPFAGLFALPFLIAGFLAWRRTHRPTAAFAAASCLTGFLFALYARPDWTLLGRYFAPYAPAAFLLFLAGVARAEALVLAETGTARTARAAGRIGAGGVVIALLLILLVAGPGEWLSVGAEGVPFLWAALIPVWTLATELQRAILARRPGARVRGAAAVALTVAIAAAGAVLTIRQSTAAVRLGFPGYVLTSRTLVEPSLWVRDALPAGATIATRRIGALAYYSSHPVFDYSFGLTEPEVARLIRRRGGRVFESPDAAPLADLWRRRAPDFLLEDREVLFLIASGTGGVPSRFAIHGMEYRVVRKFPIGRGAEWFLAQRKERR